MYESFYGLRENPFNLHPDPDYLYMSSGHENAYTHMVYAISENKGFVIITGEIGSGKTTLLNYLFTEIPQEIQIGLINNTYLSPSDFIKTMAREFEIDVKGLDKSSVIERIHGFLLEQYALRKRVMLIVDEAQNLTPKTMEEIRMISNLESEKSHLIQIVLVGQPELKYKLKRNDMQQFTQRVTVHCHLDALNHKEVVEYVKYRLRIAGCGDRNLFNDEALDAIIKYSRGIPRLINILCDTSLVYGFAESKKVIDNEIIEDVIKERSAGGIFDQQIMPSDGVKSGVENDIGDTQPINGNNGIGHLKEQMQLVERKVEYLENIIKDLTKRILRLKKQKDEKDDLVIELLKMLRENMDGRIKTLNQLSALKKSKKVKDSLQSTN